MRLFPSSILAPAAMVAGILLAAEVRAAHDEPHGCDAGIPADEKLGFTSFPRGDVFCPLIADPKTEGSFASYLPGTSRSAYGADFASVGIGDRFGLLRWNGPRIGEGLQLGLAANVYAQFDLTTMSSDLINADYVIGLPLTYRLGPFSSRLRVYHQSSHLGDEFVLRSTIQRENFAFESAEVILSVDAASVRAYGGGEYLFHRRPENLISRVIHGGAEIRSPYPWNVTDVTQVGMVAAVDVKSSDELNWSIGWSGRAGFEFTRRPVAEHRSRRWSLLGEYYDGPAPYGQFFSESVSYFGFGVHVGL